MSDKTDAKSAVVVGGGIGGLAAALGLRRIGWRVTVLEQASVIGEVGAGISLMTNAMRALGSLGLGDAVRSGGRVQLSTGVRNAAGRWLSRIDGVALESTLGTGVYAFHRAELYEILRSALPDECLITSAEVSGIEQDGRQVRVCYDRQVMTADLVIGADGVDSRVRAQLWPDAPAPVYSGSTVWRGVTSEAFHPTPDIGQTLHAGMEIGVMPIQDGRVCWHLVAHADAGVRFEDEFGEVERRLSGLHEPLPALLEATDPGSVLHHDIYVLATPLPTYTGGRVVLLGDAAHAMEPHLGQGACMAVEDAVVLAACLSAESDVTSALAAYSEQRRPRVEAIARASHMMGRIQKVDGRIAVTVRNTLMRLTPPSVGMKAIMKFADWTPPALPELPIPETADAAPAADVPRLAS